MRWDYGLLSVSPQPWFQVFGPYLGPVYPNCPNAQIPRNSKNWTFRWLLHWVSYHLMWNDELKTLDYFMCLPNHDFKYLGPVQAQFLQIALTPEYPKTSKVQSSHGLDIWVRNHWMWNDELKTLDCFLCIPNHDFRYLDPTWAKFPQIALMPQIPWSS